MYTEIAPAVVPCMSIQGLSYSLLRRLSGWAASRGTAILRTAFNVRGNQLWLQHAACVLAQWGHAERRWVAESPGVTERNSPRSWHQQHAHALGPSCRRHAAGLSLHDRSVRPRSCCRSPWLEEPQTRYEQQGLATGATHSALDSRRMSILDKSCPWWAKEDHHKIPVATGHRWKCPGGEIPQGHASAAPGFCAPQRGSVCNAPTPHGVLDSRWGNTPCATLGWQARGSARAESRAASLPPLPCAERPMLGIYAHYGCDGKPQSSGFSGAFSETTPLQNNYQNVHRSLCYLFFLHSTWPYGRFFSRQEPDRLDLMDPPDTARPSLYKGCLVWVAMSSKIREILSQDHQSEEAFHRYFSAGQLHLVTSSDVTNSKIKLQPRLAFHTEAAAPQGSTEPEPELPGAEAPAGVVMIRGREVTRLQ